MNTVLPFPFLTVTDTALTYNSDTSVQDVTGNVTWTVSPTAPGVAFDPGSPNVLVIQQTAAAGTFTVTATKTVNGTTETNSTQVALKTWSSASVVKDSPRDRHRLIPVISSRAWTPYAASK